MKQFSRVLRKIISLKWYYQLLLTLIIVVSAFALYKLLSWLLRFILGGLFLIGLFTEGKAFYMMWNNYKQSKQAPANPLYGNFYHWLTEEGVIELPIATLKFTQGKTWCRGCNVHAYFYGYDRVLSRYGYEGAQCSD